jgi:ribulose bisphosphate carboxylase small subunit
VNPSADDSESKRRKSTSKFLGRSTIAVMALLAPDIILTVALHQYLVALEYQKALNAVKPGTEHNDNSKPRPSNSNGSDNSKKGKNKENIGLKMFFFATMGGFCYAYKASTGSHLRTLAFDTLLRRKTMEMIREYPLSNIEDKSKASGISKTVAVVQTGWVLLQCLGRYSD